MTRTNWNLGGTGTGRSPEEQNNSATGTYNALTDRECANHAPRLVAYCASSGAKGLLGCSVSSPKESSYFLTYHSALMGVQLCHFSGRSSRAKIAVTGQTGTQAPQSMHSVGLM